MPENKSDKQVSLTRWWRQSAWHKVLAIFFVCLIIVLSSMYAVAYWYQSSQRNKPLTFGTTFIPSYARYLGVDPEESMSAMIDDLGLKHFRLVSYWNEIERTPGTYDFSQLDWQFKLAEERDAEIMLTVGLRQPRWPECHMPGWARELPKHEWYPKLQAVMRAIVERYKDSPALKSYQLENEYFLKVFGECPDHDRARLVDEFKYLRSLDHDRPIIITRSNNATLTWPVGQPRGDLFGAAIYKRIWDRTITKRYVELPIPPWFYSFLAGGAKLTTGRDSFIHELQAEPWLPANFDLRTASSDEMYKTFGPKDVRPRLKYGADTGMRPIYLWGGEWWYYMKEVRDQPEVWNRVREELGRYD